LREKWTIGEKGSGGSAGGAVGTLKRHVGAVGKNVFMWTRTRAGGCARVMREGFFANKR